MKRVISCLVAVTALGVTAVWSQQPQTTHVAMRPAELKWGAAPPVFAKGAQMAVLSGDPMGEGLYAVRLRMPAGYRVAPHWHPTDEHVTVIEGSLSVGMGEKFDPSAGKELTAGGYALMPAEMRHFVWTKTGATVQVEGQGPFKLTYVNPADDPSRIASR